MLCFCLQDFLPSHCHPCPRLDVCRELMTSAGWLLPDWHLLKRKPAFRHVKMSNQESVLSMDMFIYIFSGSFDNKLQASCQITSKCLNVNFLRKISIQVLSNNSLFWREGETSIHVYLVIYYLYQLLGCCFFVFVFSLHTYKNFMVPWFLKWILL